MYPELIALAVNSCQFPISSDAPQYETKLTEIWLVVLFTVVCPKCKMYNSQSP